MDERLGRRVEEAGLRILYDPPADGDCFYHAAAYQLGCSSQLVKNILFDFLKNNQIDVSNLLIISSYNFLYIMLILR